MTAYLRSVRFQEASSDSMSEEEEGRPISSSPAQSAPEARLIMKNLQKSVLGLALGNRPLIVSLNAKLNACTTRATTQHSPPVWKHISDTLPTMMSR